MLGVATWMVTGVIVGIAIFGLTGRPDRHWAYTTCILALMVLSVVVGVTKSFLGDSPKHRIWVLRLECGRMIFCLSSLIFAFSNLKHVHSTIFAAVLVLLSGAIIATLDSLLVLFSASIIPWLLEHCVTLS